METLAPALLLLFFGVVVTACDSTKSRGGCEDNVASALAAMPVAHSAAAIATAEIGPTFR